MELSILIVSKDERLLTELHPFLARKAVRGLYTPTLESSLEIAAEGKPELAVIDAPAGDRDIELLRKLKKKHPSLQIILLTDGSSLNSGRDAFTIGVRNFVPKPFDLETLSSVISVALGSIRKRKTRDALSRATLEEFGFERIIGVSEGFKETLDVARRVSESDATSVLIRGESGTGKELIARAIHAGSRRRDGPFVDVNCAAIPDNLLESELFGHEKGAFTDAGREKIGLFEMADGGTIFLDEIGELGFELQAKLLRFLDTKMVRRIAGSLSIAIDARIIAATNRELQKDVENKKFRGDLYYRLNVVELRIPPLRERGDDVVLLARHFIEKLRTDFKKPGLSLSRTALAAIRKYNWPGNVRELMNVLERAVLLSKGGVIEPSDLPLGEPRSGPHGGMSSGIDDVRIELPDEGITLEVMERKLIEATLEKCGWNVVKAAKLLGVGRGTLRYRMKKYRIEPALEESFT
ncbi:MAG: sigma-54 dependent transcriptional regulator [Candidatus Eisenbacteria bacterium]|nr:sigma-54 dependent transcriptional regulator [Candidatus Eisenbacteria bacterium]